MDLRINENLKATVGNPKSVLSGALPFYSDISSDGIDLEELLRMTPDEIVDFQKSAKQDLDSILHVEQQLDSQATNYKTTLTLLSEEDRELWDEALIDEEREATKEDLLEFVQESLKPWYENQLTVATHHSEIKAQALGESVQPHLLQSLNRYETHLDRKFQRTLAMLIKLKELRNS